MTQRTRPFVNNLQYYDDRAQGLLEVLPDGATATLTQVRNWHPAYARMTDAEIQVAAEDGVFTLDDARLVYAREHGFESWDDFLVHVRRLAAGELTEPFAEVMAAGEEHDWSRVTALLRKHPDLLSARGTNGNTLLNIACGLVGCASDSTGDDTGRLAPIRLLLEAGADPNQPNDRGWTPLHQAGYCNDAALARLLLRADGRVDAQAHGTGGTPLAAALFWGHREVAEYLADVQVVPANLRIAAGLGRMDLIDRCFGQGALTLGARAERGFYRPHSGFPRWRPSDEPQEVLDEALVWAAKADRTEVMPRLVADGARLDADPYRGTALLWAAANGRLGAVEWLLDHGADVNQRATFGGPTHGQGVTALHLAAQDDGLAVAELLVARGADPTIEDDLYHSTPGGWAEHCGSGRVAAFIAGDRASADGE